MNAAEERPPWLKLLAAYILLWTVLSWLRSPSLDSYGDMVENYAWGQTWEWGSFKHPPLFAWLVRLWFSLLPTTTGTYYLLSYINAATGALGIAALCRLWLPPLSAVQRQNATLLVLLFALGGLPYANLAGKFNADTILLSLWPWTAYAFCRAAAPAAALRWSVLLGILAGAAVLGKYFSAVLLLALFLISFTRPWRGWYLSTRPYLALAIFLALLAPHLYWEYRLDFPFRHYLGGKIESGSSPLRMLYFFLSGIYYWFVPWLLFACCRRCWRPRHTAAPALPLKSLWLLVLLPTILTLALHLLLRIHLTTHWAIPLWFALPPLLTLWLLPRLPQVPLWPPARRPLVIAAVLLALGNGIYVADTALRGKAAYTYSRQALVIAADTVLHEKYPAVQLGWVGGNWPESASFAFYHPAHPRALPGMPDEKTALVNPHPAWAQQYGLLLCAGRYGTGRDQNCESAAEQWLAARGIAINKYHLNYRAEGWRYPAPQDKTAVLYWIPPHDEPRTQHHSASL